MPVDPQPPSAAERMLYCDYCGDELGYGQRVRGEPECCGSAECSRALREMEREYEAEVRERAAEDDYDRYR